MELLLQILRRIQHSGKDLPRETWHTSDVTLLCQYRGGDVEVVSPL